MTIRNIWSGNLRNSEIVYGEKGAKNHVHGSTSLQLRLNGNFALPFIRISARIVPSEMRL